MSCKQILYYLKIKVSGDTAQHPTNIEVNFGSSPVIAMNKPTETCRQTSDLPGSHPIIYQKASFSDCLGVKHGVDPRQFHPNRGCVVISTP